MLEEDCSKPFSKTVLNNDDKICIKWNPVKDFATGEIPGISDVEVGIFVHFTGPGVSYEEAEPGNTSGWGTVDVSNNSLPNKDFSTTDDGEAIIFPKLSVSDDISNPPPSLIFIRVTAVVNGIEVFASTPLISYIPILSGQGDSGSKRCDSIKDSAVFTTRSPSCPQNANQAFFDTFLVVDSGCVEGSKAPFNCYTNPGARKCFRILQRYTVDTIICA